MSTDQEYWDACLIRGWRKGLLIRDVKQMYESITNKASEIPSLLRTPKADDHYNWQVTVFVAQQLPKISTWLFKYGAEKDPLLLKKLSIGKYTTLSKRQVAEDVERAKLAVRLRHDRTINEYVMYKLARRNSRTDLNVVKNPAPHKKR